MPTQIIVVALRHELSSNMDTVDRFTNEEVLGYKMTNNIVFPRFCT